MMRTVLLIIPILLVVSCSKERSGPSLDAEKLAEGMGVSWWIIEAPEDISMDDRAGLGYRLPDGTEKFLGYSDWWKPKEEAYVFSWIGEDGVSWMRIVRDGVSTPSKLVGVDFEGRAGFFSSGNDRIYNFGDVFAKMGSGQPGESFSEGNILYENQIGFFVDFATSTIANKAVVTTPGAAAPSVVTP